MTAELTRVLLYDSLKIMAYREDEIPHYTEQDVLDMLGRVTPMRYHRCPEESVFRLPSHICCWRQSPWRRPEK